MNNTRIALIAAAALFFAAYGQDSQRQADVQRLRDTETRWNGEYAQKDLDKIADHYTEDAVLMGPGMTPATGSAAVRRMLAGMIADPALSLKFHATRIEVSKSGDMGYTQGTYEMTMTDPASKREIHDHGSYVTIYSKQADGSWKAVADIACSAWPLALPAADSAKQ